MNHQLGIAVFMGLTLGLLACQTAAPSRGVTCDPAYPGVCIPPPPPDLDCGEISHGRFQVLASDPHGFDRDKDGIGCESRSELGTGEKHIVRGFFTNSPTGSIGDIDRAMNPTTLAVLGLLITLAAASMSLFRGR